MIVPEKIVVDVCEFFHQYPGATVQDCTMKVFQPANRINAILEGTPQGRLVVSQGFVVPPTNGTSPGWTKYMPSAVRSCPTDVSIMAGSLMPSVAEGLSPVLAETATILNNQLYGLLRRQGRSPKMERGLKEYLVMNASVLQGYQQKIDESEDLNEDRERQRRQLEQFEAALARATETLDKMSK